jgi:hypothetical protein
MQFLRRLHLYLGCIFAPILIFFAVTGAWQVFRLQDSRKDGSYTAPRVFTVLSLVHTDAHLPPTTYRKATPLRWFMAGAAAGLVTTTVLGVIMAFRYSRRPITATACLIAGIAVPGLILWIYH